MLILGGLVAPNLRAALGGPKVPQTSRLRGKASRTFLARMRALPKPREEHHVQCERLQALAVGQVARMASILAYGAV